MLITCPKVLLPDLLHKSFHCAVLESTLNTFPLWRNCHLPGRTRVRVAVIVASYFPVDDCNENVPFKVKKTKQFCFCSSEVRTRHKAQWWKGRGMEGGLRLSFFGFYFRFDRFWSIYFNLYPYLSFISKKKKKVESQPHTWNYLSKKNHSRFIYFDLVFKTRLL